MVREHNKMAHDALNGIRPMSASAKKKLDEDRIIRQQQEENYFQTISKEAELSK